MNLQQLHQDLVKHFSTYELASLCDSLAIDYESLGGKTLSDKAAILLNRVNRNGRWPELLRLIIQKRPQLQATYQPYLPTQTAVKDAHLAWLDGLAAGEGPAIEEPPTMRWDSGKHPRQPKD